MVPSFEFEAEFLRSVPIANAAQRFVEAREVTRRIAKEGVGLHINMDHAAIYTDPPRLITGPLRKVGYVSCWDDRCYPSPLDDDIWLYLVVSALPKHTPKREQGWFENVAAVWPIDDSAHEYVMRQEQGNPFVHHMTMGIVAPPRENMTELEYAHRVVPFMVETRRKIQQGVGEDPGNLVLALPEAVVENSEFRARLPELTRGLEGKYKLETMQGGGFLLQFFVLSGGRVEVAMRHGTTQAFNPNSVKKISTAELSVERALLEKPLAGM